MITNAERILLVENDSFNRANLRSLLQRSGYQVRDVMMHCIDQQKRAPEPHDLLVLCLPSLKLDVDLAMRWIREWRHKPILVLSDAQEPALVVQLLDAGADDFLPRSLRRDEMLARIRAAVRRNQFTGHSDHCNNCVQIGDFALDLDAKRAFVEGKDIRLTRTEFLLLAELARNPGRICTHAELLGKVWGGEYWDANHYLHVYLGRIRKKLGATYSNLLETVAGMGYILHQSVAAATATYAAV